MEVANPHTAQVSALIMQAASLEAARLEALNAMNGNLERANDWGRWTTKGSEYYSEFERWQRIMLQREAEWNAVKAQLQTARQAEAAWNDAVARAIAEGKTPEAAAIAATADAERRKLVTTALRIGLIMLGVVAIFGAIWAIKRFRKA